MVKFCVTTVLPSLGSALLHNLVKISAGDYVEFIIEPHKAESGGGRKVLGFI